MLFISNFAYFSQLLTWALFHSMICGILTSELKVAYPCLFVLSQSAKGSCLFAFCIKDLSQETIKNSKTLRFCSCHWLNLGRDFIQETAILCENSKSTELMVSWITIGQLSPDKAHNKYFPPFVKKSIIWASSWDYGTFSSSVNSFFSRACAAIHWG